MYLNLEIMTKVWPNYPTIDILWHIKLIRHILSALNDTVKPWKFYKINHCAMKISKINYRNSITNEICMPPIYLVRKGEQGDAMGQAFQSLIILVCWCIWMKETNMATVIAKNPTRLSRIYFFVKRNMWTTGIWYCIMNPYS